MPDASERGNSSSPEIALAKEHDFTLWYASYVQTYKDAMEHVPPISAG